MLCIEVRTAASTPASAMIWRKPARRLAYSAWLNASGAFSPLCRVKKSGRTSDFSIITSIRSRTGFCHRQEQVRACRMQRSFIRKLTENPAEATPSPCACCPLATKRIGYASLSASTDVAFVIYGRNLPANRSAAVS